MENCSSVYNVLSYLHLDDQFLYLELSILVLSVCFLKVNSCFHWKKCNAIITSQSANRPSCYTNFSTFVKKNYRSYEQSCLVKLRFITPSSYNSIVLVSPNLLVFADKVPLILGSPTRGVNRRSYEREQNEGPDPHMGPGMVLKGYHHMHRSCAEDACGTACLGWDQ